MRIRLLESSIINDMNLLPGIGSRLFAFKLLST